MSICTISSGSSSRRFVLAPEDGILMDAFDGMVGEVPRDVDLPPRGGVRWGAGVGYPIFRMTMSVLGCIEVLFSRVLRK